MPSVRRSVVLVGGIYTIRLTLTPSLRVDGVGWFTWLACVVQVELDAAVHSSSTGLNTDAGFLRDGQVDWRWGCCTRRSECPYSSSGVCSCGCRDWGQVSPTNNKICYTVQSHKCTALLLCHLHAINPLPVRAPAVVSSLLLSDTHEA